MVKIVAIAECTGCEACVEACPCDVLKVVDEKVKIVEPDECVDCGTCVDECPNDVLEVKE